MSTRSHTTVIYKPRLGESRLAATARMEVLSRLSGMPFTAKFGDEAINICVPPRSIRLRKPTKANSSAQTPSHATEIEAPRRSTGFMRRLIDAMFFCLNTMR